MKVKSILVLSALLVISSLGLVSSTYAETAPGASFSSAPLVEQGIYSGILGNNETLYYKFNALKGQTANLSAVFARSNSLGENTNCTCLVPAINAYNKNMVNVGSSVAKEYYHDMQTVNGITHGPYCIRDGDTSPNTLAGYYKVLGSGVNYVAVSAGWNMSCGGSEYIGTAADSFGKSRVALDQKKDLSKTHYDLNITVEGTPDADAGTTPVATTTTTVSGTSSISICQFVDLLITIGVIDPVKAPIAKASLKCS